MAYNEDEMTRMRINKFISASGPISRRKADELIRQQRVLINSRTAKIGEVVDTEKDRISIDGKYLKPGEKYYLVFYKPRFVITTMHDPLSRPCVRDFIPSGYTGVFPVGRLDFDARGLIILTNDGDFAHILHHPSYGIPKKYRVFLRPEATRESIEMMSKGIFLDGKKVRMYHVKVLCNCNKGTKVELVLHQGMKNQIKRMVRAVGLDVVDIKRISIGPVSIGSMKPGDIRPLRRKELDDIYNLLKRHKET